MRKLLSIALVSVFFVSCSDDNSTQQEDFFNLNSGNLRVYKRFHSADGISFTPSARIDSVFTTGDSIVADLTYEKFQHKVYVSGVFSEHESILELLRVDSNGHLVNPAGFVYHPGYDSDFTAVREYYVSDNLLGNIHYESEPQTSVVVEGNTYSVYPYVGNYLPLDSSLPQQYIFDQYQPGLGLVNQHCSAVSGASCYEDRLISYQVN